MVKKTLLDELNDYKKKVSKMDVEKLNQEVSFFSQKKEEECYDKGHKPKKNFGYIASGLGGVKAHEICERCGMFYERNLTPEEMDKWYDMMSRRFDI
ncbi:hypothetical protein M0R19_02975 [Candidatus Pacearchaeota archaeon]|jgi:hypothetical protein|nr:hypothetical protein [Candidatus Pacearchaeota archaeon]